ncbi:hypothetical protein ACFQH7_05395 [Microbulbifer taiwanensis]
MRAFARLGTRKVRLSGGEPSLRADLPDIIAAARNTPVSVAWRSPATATNCRRSSTSGAAAA